MAPPQLELEGEAGKCVRTFARLMTIVMIDDDCHDEEVGPLYRDQREGDVPLKCHFFDRYFLKNSRSHNF